MRPEAMEGRQLLLGNLLKEKGGGANTELFPPFPHHLGTGMQK